MGNKLVEPLGRVQCAYLADGTAMPPTTPRETVHKDSADANDL